MHHFSPLFQMGPARRDHIPAFRVALGVAIAMFTMLALGRLNLAIYANFGALTGVYGRHTARGVRLKPPRPRRDRVNAVGHRRCGVRVARCEPAAAHRRYRHGVVRVGDGRARERHQADRVRVCHLLRRGCWPG